MFRLGADDVEPSFRYRAWFCSSSPSLANSAYSSLKIVRDSSWSPGVDVGGMESKDSDVAERDRCGNITGGVKWALSDKDWEMRCGNITGGRQVGAKDLERYNSC